MAWFRRLIFFAAALPGGQQADHDAGQRQNFAAQTAAQLSGGNLPASKRADERARHDEILPLRIAVLHGFFWFRVPFRRGGQSWSAMFRPVPCVTGNSPSTVTLSANLQKPAIRRTAYCVLAAGCNTNFVIDYN